MVIGMAAGAIKGAHNVGASQITGAYVPDWAIGRFQKEHEGPC